MKNPIVPSRAKHFPNKLIYFIVNSLDFVFEISAKVSETMTSSDFYHTLIRFFRITRKNQAIGWSNEGDIHTSQKVKVNVIDIQSVMLK